MTPTMELRFVERTITTYQQHFDHAPTPIKKTVRILQQKWIEKTMYDDDPEIVEWRDVPIAKESDK